MHGVGSQAAARQMMNDWTHQVDPRHLILYQTKQSPNIKREITTVTSSYSLHESPLTCLASKDA